MAGWPTEFNVRPLEAWPGTETATRRASPFSATYSATKDLLRHELHHAGAEDVVLQVGVHAKDFGVRGWPLAHATVWTPGVVLSYTSPEGPLPFPCDSFLKWQDNLRAIALTLESLRRINRYGVAKTGEQYRGWLALEETPTSGTMTAQDAWQRLADIAGTSDQATTDERLVRLAKAKAHPDRHGGSATLWDEVAELAALLGTS